MVMTADEATVDVTYEPEAAAAGSRGADVNGRLLALLRQAEAIHDGGDAPPAHSRAPAPPP